ncbi:hypothetical protein WHI96_14555 [Pseudonocardia tropica]|uniref:Uncharacterized protein n=1 Tax=Pseudonocardia tropica TaxID=681289 RepID=A0ABV1JY47_9PSEU
MANADEYERVLDKGEITGLGSLNGAERELLARMARESGSRGNRARRLLDGR